MTHTYPDFIIRLEEPDDATNIDSLLDKAFGSDRFSKTTYKFRENTDPVKSLSFVAIAENNKLVGTIRFWPLITAHGDRILLLGPLAVDAGFSGRRCGLSLMEVGIEAAKKMEEKLIILVGDEPYYGKVGFARVPLNHFTFPGPVDDDRILALELAPNVLEAASGRLAPFKA